jgi:hypothetical protein
MGWPWPVLTNFANEIFEWIEFWYNKEGRHFRIGMLSPEFEFRITPSVCHQTAVTDATPDVSGNLFPCFAYRT